MAEKAIRFEHLHRAPDGTLELRFEVLEGKPNEYMRFTIPPDETIDPQAHLAFVVDQLAKKGFATEAVSNLAPMLKDIASTVHTPEVVAAYMAAQDRQQGSSKR